MARSVPSRQASPQPGRGRGQARRYVRQVLPAPGPPGRPQDSRQMTVSRVGDGMAKVVVRFFDDETLEGVARDLDFDEPDFLVEVDDAGGVGRHETAWSPLPAVEVGDAAPSASQGARTPRP